MQRTRGSGTRAKRRGGGCLLLIIIILAIILAVIGGIGAFLMGVYRPSSEYMDYFEFHAVDSEPVIMVLNDVILGSEYTPIVQNGELYLPFDFVRQFVDEWIFWDEPTGRLTITNQYFVIRIDLDEFTYYVNSRPTTLDQPIFYRNGTIFIPAAFLEKQYDININFPTNEQGEGRIVWVHLTSQERQSAHITENTVLRFEPHRWSPIAAELSEGSQLTIFAPEYGEVLSYLHYREMSRVESVLNRRIDEKYMRVRTDNGLIGYVIADLLSEIQTIPGYVRELVRPDYIPPRPIDGKVVMVWDMMEYQFQNTPWTKNDHSVIDVISPQWFRFNRETYSGEILSIACQNYMQWAHERGYHIWPKVFDSEDGNVTGLILTDQERREYVIQQLLDFIDIYNLDGINIDFERVRQVDIRYFHQFLRELWPPMRERGAILSAAVFVPSAWSLYYDRGAIAQAVDFVAVMAYDEHTIHSSEPGPNASIGFVTTAVQNMLFNPPPGQLPVPPEKLILCVPFYTRVWIETEDEDGEVTFRVRSLGMNFARRLFEENGAVFEWQYDIGKYYAEFEIFEDGAMRQYRTWLEDIRSMTKKVDLVTRYDLAGVAAWVWGLEKESIWDLFYAELKSQ